MDFIIGFRKTPRVPETLAKRRKQTAEAKTKLAQATIVRNKVIE